MLFAALAMTTMVNAAGHEANVTDMDGDMGLTMDDEMEMHNTTNSTMDEDGDRDIVSSAGRIGAMASVAAIVAGSFAF